MVSSPSAILRPDRARELSLEDVEARQGPLQQLSRQCVVRPSCYAVREDVGLQPYVCCSSSVVAVRRRVVGASSADRTQPRACVGRLCLFASRFRHCSSVTYRHAIVDRYNGDSRGSSVAAQSARRHGTTCASKPRSVQLVTARSHLECLVVALK